MPNPVFFVSYAREDIKYPQHRESMKRFVDYLSAKVSTKLAIASEGIRFFDESSIPTGAIWRDELVEGLKIARVAVALYSPFYFNSSWCGKEFQVFLDRSASRPPAAHAQSGIIPVLWLTGIKPPASVEGIQYKHDSFPSEYEQIGIQQLLALKVLSDQYEMAVEAIASAIVTAATPGLPPLASLDLTKSQSAWEASSANDPNSHKKGAIAKTCFVFAARKGWEWRPYPAQEKAIGAMAQQISGELGLRYEEIACNSELPSRLQETRDGNVPTVLFADPDSLQDNAFCTEMREYDNLNLLNCGALVPWNEASKAANDVDVRWTRLKTKVFKQKTYLPPPNHEWRTIFSQEELETKTRTVIENIRLRLLQQILSEDRLNEPESPERLVEGVSVRKVTNQELTQSAAKDGINTELAPQIEGPSR